MWPIMVSVFGIALIAFYALTSTQYLENSDETLARNAVKEIQITRMNAVKHYTDLYNTISEKKNLIAIQNNYTERYKEWDWQIKNPDICDPNYKAPTAPTDPGYKIADLQKEIDDIKAEKLPIPYYQTRGTSILSQDGKHMFTFVPLSDPHYLPQRLTKDSDSSLTLWIWSTQKNDFSTTSASAAENRHNLNTQKPMLSLFSNPGAKEVVQSGQNQNTLVIYDQISDQTP